MAQETGTGPVTALLQQAREGRATALSELFELVYKELREMARQQIKSRGDNRNVDATALVNAACARLIEKGALKDLQNRRHFFFALDRAIHDTMVEEIRSEAARKRGGGKRRVPLLECQLEVVRIEVDPSELRSALADLSTVDEETAHIVKLIALCGQTLAEASETVGLTFSVTRRHWDYGRAWLHERLFGENTRHGPGPGA